MHAGIVYTFVGIMFLLSDNVLNQSLALNIETKWINDPLILYHTNVAMIRQF